MFYTSCIVETSAHSCKKSKLIESFLFASPFPKLTKTIMIQHCITLVIGLKCDGIFISSYDGVSLWHAPTFGKLFFIARSNDAYIISIGTKQIQVYVGCKYISDSIIWKDTTHWGRGYKFSLCRIFFISLNIICFVIISLIFASNGSINYKAALLQTVAWCRVEDKPLS